jgi:hypothetical protein
MRKQAGAAQKWAHIMCRLKMARKKNQTPIQLANVIQALDKRRA